jgi:creatinine amidohydrolase
MSARRYGGLTATEVCASVSGRSVLCIPIGSYEQHGAHLPLETDTIIAQGFTERLLARYGEEFDLWATPAIPYGLSLEHAWSPGTVSLTARAFVSLLDAVVDAYVRASPVRNVLIVNGHGGNRGILEAVLYELQRDHGVNPCVIHPSSLSSAKIASSLPEVHAGLRETSVMLALSPDDVHIDRIPADYVEDQSQKELVRRFVLDRGTTWPWSSGDPGISASGIMGSDPRNAASELGEAVLASALDNCRTVLETLRDRRAGTKIMAD